MCIVVPQKVLESYTLSFFLGRLYGAGQLGGIHLERAGRVLVTDFRINGIDSGLRQFQMAVEGVRCSVEDHAYPPFALDRSSTTFEGRAIGMTLR
jgi:hypothetical protein